MRSESLFAESEVQEESKDKPFVPFTPYADTDNHDLDNHDAVET
jgi:hypothetical protein